VSAQTLVYLYNQRQLVVLLEITANANRRYEKVYSKDLTINRGVDNLIEFSFVNQEQKPVNIQGKEITCRIIDFEGDEVLLQKTLTHILPITGITSLQLSAAEIAGIDAQKCYYSLEIPVDTFDYPVFVDDNAGARGVLNIVNSVLPRFVASNNVTIPTHPRPKAGLPRTYYSSIFNTKQRSILTAQVFFSQFTGTIEFQGSTVQNFSTYYAIGLPHNYTDHTGTMGLNITGYHPFIRLKIVNDGTEPADSAGDLLGDITRILTR
jgi:hypothetical protein